MSLSREQGTNSEHCSEASLKGGGWQGGFIVNSEKFVVFFCVFVFESTSFFHIISRFCKISKIIIFFQ